MIEVDHHVSKEATNCFFDAGKKWFSLLERAKTTQGVGAKTPTFAHLRKKLYDAKVPKISMEISYKHRITGEITTVKDVESTPVGKYPRHEYEKLYESASVEVKQLYLLSFNELKHVCVFFRLSSIFKTCCFSLLC